MFAKIFTFVEHSHSGKEMGNLFRIYLRVCVSMAVTMLLRESIAPLIAVTRLAVISDAFKFE